MKLSNVWGQGQLFAFSALDGNSYFSDDFVGTLSGDRIGIRFFTKVKRELAIVRFKTSDLVFEAVLSDYIHAKTDGGDIRIVYSDNHLIIGDMPGDAKAVVFVEGEYSSEKTDGVTVQDTGDGQFTALAVHANQFAFAYAKDKFKAIQKAKAGLEESADAAAQKKLSYYTAHKNEGKYAKLYTKCLSVMKNQLYSPEGAFKTIWSTPDRLPHKYLWLWDSVFHAIGHRNTDGALAENLISAIFVYQHENGMISHMAMLERTSSVTQPPVIAWGALKVYEKTNNKAFLSEVYEKNGKFLKWCRENRRETEEELYAWFTDDNKNCRCGESGMDNSPRFDEANHLHAIDFSCFMANETRCMAKIAEILGKDGSDYLKWYEEIKTAIQNKLWADDFYYDYDLEKDRMHNVKSVASFLPLFAGVCDEKRAKALVEKLNDSKAFCTEFPVPSIAMDDPTFGTDMWRGPVWINYNYMIIEGLREYGYLKLAEKIEEKTLDVVNEWYEKTGTVFEFYDCENKKSPKLLTRKGNVVEPYNFEIRMQAVRDYGWTATLTLDMIEHFNQ